MNKSQINRNSNVKTSTLKCALCLIIFLVTQQLAAQSLTLDDTTSRSNMVKVTAVDQFKLSAKLHLGSAKAGGVLLLHDCKNTSKDFQGLYSALVKQNFFVLALDLRGFGASQSQNYSDKSLRIKADNIVSYQGQLATLMMHWQNDVYLAFQYLQGAMKNKQGISVVTSGCSSNQAIYLAQKNALKSVVMLSPELSVDDKEQFKHLADMPIYLLSANYLTEAMLNAQELFEWSGDSQSVLQTFKGNDSSFHLLKKQTYLNNNISIWLKSTLVE